MSDEIIAGIIGAAGAIIAALIQDSSPETKRRWLVAIGVGLACVTLFLAGRGIYGLYREHQPLPQGTESSGRDETNTPEVDVEVNIGAEEKTTMAEETSAEMEVTTEDLNPLNW